MDAPSFTAFLLIQGRRFVVESLSEGGMTISPEPLALEPFRSAVRGAGAEASLELYEDGAVEAYTVRLRLAGIRSEIAEFAFIALPPALRRRLRQPEPVAADAVETEALPLAFARATARPPTTLASGRRLVLPGSETVWSVTEARRCAFAQGRVPRPLVTPGQAVDVAEIARVRVGRYVVASCALMVALVLAAWLSFG